MSSGEEKDTEQEFFKDGFFDWQLSAEIQEQDFGKKHYDEDAYWGGFSKEPFDAASYKAPDWAITNIVKYEGNPIMAPSAGSWDCGHYGGGVHNGSVLKRNGKFYYLYRGEFPLSKEECVNHPSIDYKCDVGIAVSGDGINFVKDTVHSPLFRHGGDELFSFEDICVVKHGEIYYMFLNRWDWTRINDPAVSGVYLAVSNDLLKWEKCGLVFPNASRIHRNACVLQNPNNEAVRVNGKFIMYINDGLAGISDDMIHWESVETKSYFPGGEGCFALADYDKNNPDAVLLFTGGHHTGHFYAVGEVLLNKKDPLLPIEWLPRPVITAEDKYPYECGFSADGKHKISHWTDTIFFTGMTEHNGKYMFYYGGSEYYTCLATADAKQR